MGNLNNKLTGQWRRGWGFKRVFESCSICLNFNVLSLNLVDLTMCSWNFHMRQARLCKELDLPVFYFGTLVYSRVFSSGRNRRFSRETGLAGWDELMQVIKEPEASCAVGPQRWLVERRITQKFQNVLGRRHQNPWSSWFLDRNRNVMHWNSVCN